MNEKLNAHDEMEIIESIIYTFEGYALNDLQNSRLECSATGILLMQVLDDVSGFLFRGSPRERVGQLVASYLPEHAELAVYDTLKNSLVFNYVVNTAGASPSNGGHEMEPTATYEELPVEAIIKDLREAFRVAFEDLRSNPEKRQQALEWYQTHKVYYLTCSIYNEAQKQKLRDYYLPHLMANSLFPGHTGEVDLYFCAQRDNNYQIFVEVEDLRVVKDSVRIPLNLVIAWMGLRKVEEVLA